MVNRNINLVISTLVVGLLVSGCGKSQQSRVSLPSTDGEVTILGDVWADNWFALYNGENLLIEDSVSITTERSFNAESFSFKADYPVTLNFIVKDFKENDTGLEYIGTRKQQLGDGGFIAQFREANTGELLMVTTSKWRYKVLHHGPENKGCALEETPIAGEGPCGFTKIEEPANWKSTEFSTDQWPQAREFSASDVRPKDGYDQVEWDKSARLIWSNDLEKDNTILFRMVIERPKQ